MKPLIGRKNLKARLEFSKKYRNFGTGSLIFTDDGCHDASCRMNSGLYRNIPSPSLQRTACSLIGRNLIRQQDNDPYYTSNTTKVFIGGKDGRI